jgi:hypothetical protein
MALLCPKNFVDFASGDVNIEWIRILGMRTRNLRIK